MCMTPNNEAFYSKYEGFLRGCFLKFLPFLKPHKVSHLSNLYSLCSLKSHIEACALTSSSGSLYSYTPIFYNSNVIKMFKIALLRLNPICIVILECRMGYATAQVCGMLHWCMLGTVCHMLLSLLEYSRCRILSSSKYTLVIEVWFMARFTTQFTDIHNRGIQS